MKYIVSVQDQSGEFTEVGSKGKKDKALELAQATRDETRRTVQVHTDKGTLVEEIKGVRPMKSTPRFSKVVDMPEGVEVPEGARPAYLRLKHDGVIVHFADAEKDKQYGIVRVSTGKLIKQRFARTRDAGAFVKTLETPKARARRLEAERAAQAGGEQPQGDETPAPSEELVTA